MKRWITCLFLVLSCFTATACWDDTEIDKLAIVTASGIDVMDPSGNSQNFLATAQVANPSLLGATRGGGIGGTLGSEKAFQIVQATGTDVTSIIAAIQKKNSRKMILSHRIIIVVGEDYARQSVHSLVDEIVRNPNSRLRTIFLVAYHDRAENILKIPYPLEKLPMEAVIGLERQQSREEFSTKDFIAAMTGKGDPYAEGIEQIPITIRNSEKGFALSHIALFQLDRLVGWLSENEVSAFFLMRGTLRKEYLTISIPGHKGHIGTFLTKAKTSHQVLVQNGKPRIVFDVDAENDVFENGTDVNLRQVKNIPFVESVIEKQLSDDMKETMNTLQQKYEVDPIGVMEWIYESHPDAWEGMKTNWRSRYRTLPVDIHVKVRLERGGLVSGELPSGEGSSR